jgi:hypothetical protein
MDPGRWHQIAHIYEAVLERTAEERGPFLAEASAGDEELRREVESLLADDSAPLLIDRPMLEAAAVMYSVPTFPLMADGSHMSGHRTSR